MVGLPKDLEVLLWDHSQQHKLDEWLFMTRRVVCPGLPGQVVPDRAHT